MTEPTVKVKTTIEINGPVVITHADTARIGKLVGKSARRLERRIVTALREDR